MRLRFSKTVKFIQADPANSRTYEEGKEYELDQAHAERWLRRGVAEVVEVSVEAKPIPAVKAAEEIKTA